MSKERISIHASREGSDSMHSAFFPYDKDFNPRFPRGKRPYVDVPDRQEHFISIHASREGSDDS